MWLDNSEEWTRLADDDLLDWPRDRTRGSKVVADPSVVHPTTVWVKGLMMMMMMTCDDDDDVMMMMTCDDDDDDDVMMMSHANEQNEDDTLERLNLMKI